MEKELKELLTPISDYLTARGYALPKILINSHEDKNFTLTLTTDPHFESSKETKPENNDCCEDGICDNSYYLQMVESLAEFVIRTAQKDNPTDAELNAMVEMSKMLFRTM